MSTSQAAPAPKNGSSDNSWNRLYPARAETEDAMGAADVEVAWTKMYKLAGLSSANEERKKGFRMAVYVYGLLNGTTREGKYSKPLTMFDGTVCDSAVIPRAVGKMQIRQFFRGNMVESYEALRCLSEIDRPELERFFSSCETFGIPRAVAFATADWLKDCALFTPAEKAAHEKSKNISLDNSRRNRGGRSLEEVETDRIDQSLAVQGRRDANHAASGPVDF